MIAVTPQELSDDADVLAAMLLRLPELEKDSELRRLKADNELMHAMVMAKLGSIRRRCRR